MLLKILPHNIQQKIIIDATVLSRNELGWNKINEFVKNNEICLCKTNNVYTTDMKFEGSRRVTQLLKYERIYMWLHAANDGGNAYSYESKYYTTYSMNDIYSFIEDDEFIEDEDDDCDYYETFE